MEALNIFFSIIIIIFGILQIILFFKLWGMTNDVRIIKKHLTNDHLFDPEKWPNPIEKAKKDIFIGDCEKARKYLLSVKYDIIEHKKECENITYMQHMSEKYNEYISEIDNLITTINSEEKTSL